MVEWGLNDVAVEEPTTEWGLNDSPVEDSIVTEPVVEPDTIQNVGQRAKEEFDYAADNQLPLDVAQWDRELFRANQDLNEMFSGDPSEINVTPATLAIANVIDKKDNPPNPYEVGSYEHDLFEKGPVTAADQFAKEWFSQQGLTTKIPIAGGFFGAGYAVEAKVATKRIMDDKYIDEIEATQTAVDVEDIVGPINLPKKEDDIAFVESYLMYMYEQEVRGMTDGAKIMQGVSVLPTYMVEFIATGGIAKLGSEPAKYAATKLLSKYTINKGVRHAVTKGAGVVAGGVAKAWGNQVIEAISEESGALIEKPLKALGRKALTKMPFVSKMFGKFKELRPKGTFSQFVDAFFTKAGWNGMVGEYGEERIGTTLRGLTGVDDYDINDPNPFTRTYEMLKIDLKNAKIEIPVLMVPGSAKAAIGVGGTAVNLLNEKTVTDEAKRILAEEGRRVEEEVVEEPAEKPTEEVAEEPADKPIAEPVAEPTPPQAEGEVSPIDAVKSRGVDGDKLLDVQDLIEEVESNGGIVNEDGTVTLYHRTNAESRAEIEKTGEMKGLEDGIFFSTKKDGQAKGFGDEVVEVRVEAENLELDDVFGDEAHLKLSTKKAGDTVKVNLTKAAQPQKAEAKPVLEANTAKEVDNAIKDIMGYTGPRQADIEHDKEALGLSGVPSKVRVSRQEQYQEAIDQGIPDKALDISADINAKPRAMTPAESAGVTIALVKAKREYADAHRDLINAKTEAEERVATATEDRLEAEFESMYNALYKSGSERGRALASQRYALDKDFSFISIQTEARIKKGENLTSKEKKELKRLTESLEEAEKEIESLRAEIKESKMQSGIRTGSRARFRGMTNTQRDTNLADLVSRTKKLLEEGCYN
jgi:hypothetical protein